MSHVLFNPGRVAGTPAALELLAKHYVLPADLLDRHVRGDWGDLSEDDRRANDLGVKEGDRLLSAYSIYGEDRVWIMTEADRSSTLVLLPNEY